ncbi:MAG: hypothetical protein ACXADU_13095 [Promethearchaeota archaeon]|jgi:hypothetical protein
MLKKKKLIKNPIEISTILIIRLRKKSTQSQTDIEEAQKQYELYKTLNPRYSEIVLSLKEAKLKADSSDIIYSLDYNVFRSW